MRYKAIILSICIMLSSSISAFAGSEVSVKVNDSVVNFDRNPIIENDRVLVPVRAIFEALGAKVEWKSNAKTVNAYRNNESIVLKIDSKVMIQNGKFIPLDVAPKISVDRTLVPLRAISEAFGAEVAWNAQDCSVTVNTKENSENCQSQDIPATTPPSNGSNNNNNNAGNQVTDNNNNSSQAPSGVAEAVVALVNKQRANAGLNPVTLNNNLSAVAMNHSRDMGQNNFMSHTGSNGSSPFDRIKSAGISYRTAGENVAAGQSSAEAVMNSWMNSEGHRKNILNPNFKEIGIGYYQTTSGYRHYWTQCFIG